MDGKRVFILTNPKAGARPGHAAVGRLSDLLTQLGYLVTLETNIQALAEDVQKAVEAGQLRCVVSAGGDGTAALVANHMAPSIPLAILPLGTENLLAKYLQIPRSAEKLAEIIHQGRTVKLDAGMAGNRLFMLMVGCGFDAEVVRRLHNDRDGNIHHLSYIKPILDSIRSYDYPELRIYCLDSEPTETPAKPDIVSRWAFVVNLPRYAIGLQLVSKATGADGVLDICTFKHGSFWRGLMYFAALVFGQHEKLGDCTIRSMRRLRIESDGQVPYQLDGDPGGMLPVEIEVLPQRLTLLVPKDWVEKR